MLRVPYNPGAIATPAPSVPANDYLNIQANPADFGAQVGGAEQRTGAGLMRGGEQIGQQATQLAALHDESMTRDATVQFETDAGQLWAKYATLKGSDAVNGYKPFTQQMEQLRQRVRSALPNPQAQAGFDQAGGFYQALVARAAAEHQARESVAESVDSHKAAIVNAGNQALLFQNDPDRAIQWLNQGRVHAEDLARLQTSDPTMISEAGAAAFGKNARLLVIGMAQTNPFGAQAMFERLKPQMDAADAVAIGHELKPIVTKAEGDRIYDRITGQGTTFIPRGADVGAIFPALMHAESGTKQFGPDGQPLVSPKGAVGIAQVEPATAKAVTGSAYDETRLYHDAGYNQAVGREYLGQLLQQFHDPTLAVAAYNAGPGAVEQWIKQNGDPRTGAISMSDWVAKIPLAETRDYVTRIATDLAGTDGTLAPAALNPQVMMQTALKETAGNPDLQSYVVTKLRGYISDQKALSDVHAAAVRRTVSDTERALLDGADVPIPTAQIKASLPPEEAATALYDINVAQHAGAFVKSMRWATPQEIQQGLTALEAGGATTGAIAGAATAGPKPSAEEVVFRQSVYRAVVSQVAARDRLLAKDPAAFVESNPQIQAMAAKLDPKNAAAMEGYSNAVLALEQRLGVPPDKQSVLSVQQAQSLVQKIVSEPNMDAGAALDAAAEEYGAAWPKVFGDVVRLGKLSPDFQVLAMMNMPTQMQARADLQRALLESRKAGGIKKLMASLDPAERKIIDGSGTDTTLFNELKQFDRTARSASLRGSVRESVQTLATLYAMNGMPAPTALRRAYEGIIGDRYDFDGTQRVPKGELGHVESAEAATLRGLKADDLEAVGGRVPAIAKERQADLLTAARNGYWVTNASDTGAVLMMRLNNGAGFPVLRKDGSKVEVLFAHAGAIAARNAGSAGPSLASARPEAQTVPLPLGGDE